MEIKIVEDKQEMDDAYHVRCTVFVEEQKVPKELEIDELEQDSIHFIGYEGALPVAASRIRFVEDYGKLERVCVLKTHRGKQYGKQIIQYMETFAKERGYLKSKLNGQTHAEEFYKSLGYHTISGEFMDAGIPHVTMIKEL